MPIFASAYILDNLLCRVVHRTDRGNAYRVLARKES
jgi:hypothetical protein